MKGIIYLFLLSTFLISGCGIRERETSVQNKETELTRKEQALALKEETLQLKEESLIKREQLLDSTRQDSAAMYNPNITGLWEAKMVCVETTCPGSALGDTKSETWDISYQNNIVVAKAMTGDVIVRTYTGTYMNSLLELTENVELSPNSPATQIVVRLALRNENTMEGQRAIIRSGDCRIIYSLQLSK
jgi:hypothetical protein